MISEYLNQANRVANQIPAVLVNRGLDPAIDRFLLTESGDGNAWLFAVVDHSRVARIERYITPDVIHQLSTAAGGLPVVISNSSGLRYAVLLSPKKTIPAAVEFPEFQRGIFRIGVGRMGEVAVNWAELGNVLVAGMTRSGKSNYLRLLVSQAIADGFDLYIVDPDGATFPNLARHPSVVSYSGNIDGAETVVEDVLELMIERTAESTAIRHNGGVPEFNRALLVIDEYSGLVLARGGARGVLASTVTRVAWGGLKFGIHSVLAGHEFTKDVVGSVAAQMLSRFCFRVRAPSISRLVAGRAGAERIRVSGRALSDPFGLVQVYRISDSVFDEIVGENIGDGLTDRERGLIEKIRNEYRGRVTFEALFSNGFSRSEAEKLRSNWEIRGIARKSPEDNNSIVLVI